MSLSRYLAPAVLAASLGIAAVAAPAPAQAQSDDLVRVLVDVADVVLRGSAHAERYHVFPYLSQDSLRAGATAITEIALWGKPAILIPIPESVSHDQRTNAYSYAHTGAAIVLEEENLTPNILASEIRRISGDPALRQRMGAQGRSFANPDAAKLIADELIRIGLSHLPQRPQA